MEKPTYKLEGFEGPMDLLLHLISKRKLSITDVPILELVEQYLSYIRKFRETDLEVASDFLEMAARLVYIKTVSLLPVHEEAEQLAEELRGELLEYQDCKRMAGKLSEMAQGFSYFSRDPQETQMDLLYRRLHEPIELLRYYFVAAGKHQRKLPPPLEAFSGIIAHKIVSVSSRINHVLTLLGAKRRQPFLLLFGETRSRSEMVATFLAVLSLVKAKRVAVSGEGEAVQVSLLEKGDHTVIDNEWA